MQILVFSDVHGNCIALDAMLADVRGRDLDAMICLGDALQGGPQPRQVLDRLKELGCPVVIGNADDFLVTGAVAEGASEEATEQHLRAREWTLGQLGEGGVNAIRSFVPTWTQELDNGMSLLCFHGSPGSYDEVLIPETPYDEMSLALAGADAELLTGGHTHLQWTRRVGNATYFNPGSVGVAYHRHRPPEDFHFYAFAQYAIVHAGDGYFDIEMCQAPWSPDDLERAAESNGSPNPQALAARYRPPP